MKNIVAIGPKLNQASDLVPFSNCLDFLNSEYNIHWVDPLEKYENLSFQEYADYWRTYIKMYFNDYDAFIGFALGALLLFENLDLFSESKKVIILFSPPSVLDEQLKSKLVNALKISESGHIFDAIELLDSYVHANPTIHGKKQYTEPTDKITARFEFALRYVLNHIIPKQIGDNKTRVYQLVGDKSQLVTINNILKTPNTILSVVPNAGNRVLEDNPSFTHNLVRDWLHGKH